MHHLDGVLWDATRPNGVRVRRRLPMAASILAGVWFSPSVRAERARFFAADMGLAGRLVAADGGSTTG